MGEQYRPPGRFGDSGEPRWTVTIPETTGRFQGPEEQHGSPERPGALPMPDEGPFFPGEATAPLDPGASGQVGRAAHGQVRLFSLAWNTAPRRDPGLPAVLGHFQEVI